MYLFGDGFRFNDEDNLDRRIRGIIERTKKKKKTLTALGIVKA